MLNLAYLFDPRPGPVPPEDFHLYLTLMGLSAAGLVVGLYFHFCRRSPGLAPWILRSEISLCSLVLILMASRLLFIPFLSIRALFYAAALASLSLWVASVLRLGSRRGWLGQQLTLLTFSDRESQPPLPLGARSFLLAIHILGLMVLALEFGRSWYWVAGLFALILSPQVLYSLWTRKKTLYIEALTPLWFAYLAAAGRSLATRLLIPPLPVYNGFALPDVLCSLLNVEAIFVACTLYALVCEGYVLARENNRLHNYPRYVTAGLLVAVFVWAGAEYFLHRTHGVTANDPYAYAQMAVDIARQGHPLHRFVLLPTVKTMGISWKPAVHYGYQTRVPPLRPDGSTATDWPAGWPVILSLGYLIGGEQGLYALNPIVGLLCLGVVLALVAEVLYDRPWGERMVGGAGAALVLATSYEQADRLLVPMADASAQMFTTLTLFFVLRATRGRHRLYAALAGWSFGWAYFVRHTQLVLGLCALAAVLTLGRRGFSGKQRWEFAILFGCASFVVASPDLLYHKSVFGHFLTPESTELELFGLASIPTTAGLMAQRFLSGNEFGYLSPLILYGAYRMSAERKGQFLVLLAAFLGILLVHLPYAALRLRDLLSLYPILLVWCAYGAIDLWRRATLVGREVSQRRHAPGVVILLLLALLPAWRTWSILPRPWGDYRASFGYVSAQERQAFGSLAAHTLEGGVVGSSFNGGPIELYAGREAYRPEFWTEAELDVFFSGALLRGRAVYLLDDGEAVTPALAYAHTKYQVTPVAHLTVPLFGDPRKVSGLLYRIRPLTEVPR